MREDISALGTKASLESLARQLEGSGEYRVLRKLPRRKSARRSPGPGEHVGLIVDTETTGLDPVRDEIVELGMVSFSYDDEGSIVDILDSFEGLREPSVRMSPEAQAVTGILPEQLRGRSIHAPSVIRLVEQADVVIAHNAAFDRPMCERLLPAFAGKAWACTATEIDWKARGFEGVKLVYLLNQTGFFNNGHRALDDCHSLLEVLHHKGRGSDAPLRELLESARQPRYRVWVQPPFDLRTQIRARGYRWHPGVTGRPRGWWIELPFERLETELNDLVRDFNIRSDEAVVERQTAFERYKLIGKIAPSG